jgi:thiamine-phosphate pyrophosphorylase
VKPIADCKLYAFVDTSYLRGQRPEFVAQQLCDGGADLIQLRAKHSTPDDILRMAEAVAAVTRRTHVGLVINDHPDIARKAGAELCHLGQEDFFDAGHGHVEELKIKTEKLKIGLSTHAPAQAERAVAAGADYIAIGPIFATDTKPTAQPVTLEYVRWAAANMKLPWFAIGGINLKTIDAVLAAGAQRICVVSAILNAPDIAKACAEFRRRLG